MDFEYGDATGWDLISGFVNGQVAQITNTNATTLANNDFTIYNGGNDPQGGFPRVNPNSGNYSLMIGDYTNTGYGAAAARRTFIVDSSNANFQYSFAVVLEDPGHSHGDMPFFKVNVYDHMGNLITCGEYLVVAGGNLDSTWSPYSGGWYRDWHTVFVPLEPYLGTNVTVEFVSGDCDQGGHYGYAYIDAECQSLELIPPGTEICDNQPVTFTAPNGAISYLWNTGATTQSITTNLAGTYTVVATPVQGAVCNATFSATIDVAPGVPTTNFTVDNTLCLDENFSPTDLSTSSPGSNIGYWSWDFGDGSPLQSTNNTNHFYDSVGTYEIQLITGVLSPSGSGCFDTLTHIVDVQGIEAAFEANYVCEGTVTDFTDLSQAFNAAITSWEWDFTSDGVIDNNTQNPTNGYISSGSYNASLTVETSYGCYDNIIMPITVNPVPIPNFSPNIVCLGEATTFTNLSTINSGNIVNYSWDFDNNSINSNAISPTHTYNQSGTYNITLQAQSDSGCVSFITDTVYVAELPTALFNFTDTCFMQLAQFNDLSLANNGSISTWNWDIDQNNTIDYNIASPSHLYNNPGTYNVSLVVINTYNCRDSITQPIEIYELPNSQFSAGNICADSIVNFVNNSSINNGNIINYLWDFGNGNSSNQFQPSEQFTLEGIYTVSLMSESSNGCTDSVIGQIEVYPNPIAFFNANDTCFGEAINFTDLSTVSNNHTNNNITSWNWNFNDNGAVTNTQHPSYQFSQEGAFNVQLEIITDNGCVDDTSILITVHPNPVADFMSPNPMGCSIWCVDFQNNSTISNGNIISYNWNLGDGTHSNLQHPDHCYENNGTSSDYYDITLTTISDQGCLNEVTYHSFVGIHPLPIANFTTSSLSASMYYPYFEFYDQSTIADNYNWDFNSLGSSSNSEPIFIFPEYQTGTYEICLDVSTLHGCTDQYCDFVYVNGESGIYVPNAFTPDGDGINEVFKPEMHGISNDGYRFMIFNRWGEVIFDTNIKENGWDGRLNGSIVQTDVYVWKIEARKEHNLDLITKVGHVNLLK